MPELSNVGTSKTITVGGEEIKEIKYQEIIKVEYDEATPPEMTTGNGTSIAFNKNINTWPEFAFDAITIPKYDGVAVYLGTPCNKPDFIKDYHYIALMRLTDTYLSPTYASIIVATSSNNPVAIPPPVTGDK